MTILPEISVLIFDLRNIRNTQTSKYITLRFIDDRDYERHVRRYFTAASFRNRPSTALRQHAVYPDTLGKDISPARIHEPLQKPAIPHKPKFALRFSIPFLGTPQNSA